MTAGAMERVDIMRIDPTEKEGERGSNVSNDLPSQTIRRTRSIQSIHNYLWLLSNLNGLGMGSEDEFGQRILKHAVESLACSEATLYRLTVDTDLVLVRLATETKTMPGDFNVAETDNSSTSEALMALAQAVITGPVSEPACSIEQVPIGDTGEMQWVLSLPIMAVGCTEPIVEGVIQAAGKWTPPVAVDCSVTDSSSTVSTASVGVFESSTPTAPFTEEDIITLHQIGKLVGAALRNRKLVHEAFDTTKRLEGLISMLGSVAAESSASAVLQKIFDVSRQLVAARGVTLFKMDSSRRTLTVTHAADPSVLGVVLPVGKGLAGAVARDGKAINVMDAYGDQRFNREVDEKTGFRTRCVLCVPVNDHHGNVLAVVQAVNKETGTGTFTPEDAAMLQHVAHLAGITLHKAEMMHANKQAARRLQVHSAMIQSLAMGAPLPQFTCHVEEAGKSLLSCASFRLWLVDATRKEAWTPISAENKEPQVYKVPLTDNLEQGVVGFCGQTGKSIRLDNQAESVQFTSTIELGASTNTFTSTYTNQQRSVMCVPIIVHPVGRSNSASSKLVGLGGSWRGGTIPPAIITGESSGSISDELLPPPTPITKPGMTVVAVLEAVQKLDSTCDPARVVPFGEDDELELERLREELVAPLRQLAMEIAYYKGSADSSEELQRTSISSGTPGRHHSRGRPSITLRTASISQPGSSGSNINLGGSGSGIASPARSLLAVYRRVSHISQGIMRKSRLRQYSSTASAAGAGWVATSSGNNSGRVSRTGSQFGSVDDPSLAAAAAAAAFLASEQELGNSNSGSRHKHRGSGVLSGRLSAEELSSRPPHHHFKSPISEPELLNWDLDTLSLSTENVIHYIVSTFQSFGLLGQGLHEYTVYAFAQEVSHRYRNNPYHNFHHGFQVFHATQIMMRSAAVKADAVAQLATLVAALCHDIDHPGHNNAFAVASQSDLAILYSDDSVLERHHVYETFMVLKKGDGECNLLAHLEDPVEYRAARKVIVRAILSTDMAHHADICRTLGAADLLPPTATDPLQSRAQGGGMGTADTMETSLIDAIIHAADMSAQTLRPVLTRDWGVRITLEFMQQAAEEERLGLPVAPHMQGLESPMRQIELQCDFLAYVLVPLWGQMARLLPDVLDADGGIDVLTRLEQSKKSYLTDKERLQAPTSAVTNDAPITIAENES